MTVTSSSMSPRTRSVVWTPLRLREVVLTNRVWLSPMGQYSATSAGTPNDWHLAHYGARAAGGVGMVLVECTAVAPDPRTTAADLGLWSDEQVSGHRRLAELIRSVGSVPAVQVGVSGRKSSHGVWWENNGTRRAISLAQGGWQPLAPSPIPFAGLATPREMTEDDIIRVLGDAERAARNAHRAGYQVLELHGANGYLLHQFLSPLANHRTDKWGGDLTGRMRFALALVAALRAGWPEDKPLLVRLPATDLMPGGLTLEEAITVAAEMKARGADLIDIESGTLTPEAPRIDEPLHNAHFGPAFRAAGLLTASSGGISRADQLTTTVPELVDAALIGRALLRDPYWALRASDRDPRHSWPRQYRRAF